MRCDLRSYRECGCPVGTCQQQPTPVPTIAARRGDFIRIFTSAVVVTLVAYWALNEADKGFHRQQLDRQEQEHVASK
ncbi:hypothetical protein IB244_27300 [Rhizobium sp. RHZ02]|uniref:hypothetical protein n=1 Tax=Rhizobium sp. RHZ02 TaxID=2769306 RepID=UPI00177C52BC|nr:hypothetical protein [Rhizobium sp. RHZ02]MBD9455188.1 hypothetical protein [Rhizobium sp. RHZ02]